jgi:hypothetical protein
MSWARLRSGYFEYWGSAMTARKRKAGGRQIRGKKEDRKRGRRNKDVVVMQEMDLEELDDGGDLSRGSSSVPELS